MQRACASIPKDLCIKTRTAGPDPARALPGPRPRESFAMQSFRWNEQALPRYAKTLNRRPLTEINNFNAHG